MLLPIFVLVLCSSPFLYWYYMQFKFRNLRKIPGPKPVPVLGNVLPSDPCETLTIFESNWKKYGSTFKLWLGPFLRVVISNPDHVETILTSNVHITKSIAYNLFKPVFGNSILNLTDAKWKYHRRIMTPTFHFTILEEFMKIFNKSANNLVEKLQPTVGNPEVNIYEPVSLHTLDVICETSMGTEVNALNVQSGAFVQSTRGVLTIFSERIFSAWKNVEILYRTFAANGKLYLNYLNTAHRFCDKVIKNRKDSYLKDPKQLKIEEDEFGRKKKVALIDTLLTTENTLTDEDIRNEIMTIIFAGQETSASAISFCIYLLSQYQDVQQTLYEEIVSLLGTENRNLTISEINELSYLDMVVKESQRILPSAPFFERELKSEFEIGGIKYPKGTTLNINVYLLHHDPKIYPNPEKFDPQRFSPENQSLRHKFAYVPFSAGPRNCIGQKFAVLEIKTTIVKMLQSYKILRVPGHELKLGITGTLNSLNGCSVKLQQRT